MALCPNCFSRKFFSNFCQEIRAVCVCIMKPFSSYFNNSIFEFLCISRSNCSFSANDTQSVGQLNVFTVSQGKPISLAFQKTGGDNFQSYGSSIAVGKPLPDGTPVLAVGATGQSK